MKKRKRTEIKVEIEQLLVIRQRRSSILAWCEGCHEQVTMIRPEEAAAMASLDLRAIYRSVEAGRLHFIDATDGLPLICLNSIEQELAKREGL